MAMDDKRLPALPEEEQDEESQQAPSSGQSKQPLLDTSGQAPPATGFGVKSYLHLLYERVRSQSGSQTTTPATPPASPSGDTRNNKNKNESSSSDDEEDGESQAESEYRMLLSSFESATKRRHRKGLRVFLTKLLLISAVLSLILGTVFLTFAFFYPKISPIISSPAISREHNKSLPRNPFTLFDPAILKLNSRLETLKIAGIAIISASMLVITLILLLPSLLLYYRSSGQAAGGAGVAESGGGRRRSSSGGKRDKKKAAGDSSRKRSLTSSSEALKGAEEATGCGHEDVFRLTQEISRIQPKD